MAFNGNNAGFNLTGSKLQLVEIAVKGNDVLLENADDYNFEEALVPSLKESAIISNLQTAYETFISRKKPDFSSVSFSLPSDYFRFFHLPVDKKLLKAELAEHIKWEFSILYPTENPDDYIIQHIELGTSGNQLFVICIRKNDVKKFHKFCVRNNLKLKFIDFSHLTVHNYLCNINKNEDSILSLYIGASAVSAALIRNGIVEKIRLFKWSDKEKLDSLISQELLVLFPEITENGNNFNYYLSGDELTLSESFNLGASLKVDFIKVDPFSTFKKTEATEYLENDENNIRYLAAASMALRFS